MSTSLATPLHQASLASAQLIWRAMKDGSFNGHPSGIELPAAPQIPTCGSIQRLVTLQPPTVVARSTVFDAASVPNAELNRL